MMNLERSFITKIGSALALLMLVAVPVWGQGICDGITPTTCDTLASEVRVSGLNSPLYVTAPPGDTERIFVVEQNGVIRIHKEGDAPATTSVFLDITGPVDSVGNEKGLLGLAFDPDYDSTGEFYVNYTETDAGQEYTVVARYNVSGDPDVADAASEDRILRVAQPQSNHNGGQLEFGPGGFLYIGMGDGGGSGDQHGVCGNGQNLGNLLGKMLRIDVRNLGGGTSPDCGLDANYLVPPDNPFSDGVGGDCDEIWNYGLRNPWRWAFDNNDDLYIADVGQNCSEEINYVSGASAGSENYGWRQMEGLNCFDVNAQSNCNASNVPCAGSPDCNDPSLTDPVLDFGHGPACSVTGGFVYRGCRLDAFQGVYFYGDFCAGFVRSFEISGGSVTNEQDHTNDIDPGGTLSGDLTSFGLDGRGELYICDQSGSVLKVVDGCDPDCRKNPANDADGDAICDGADNCPNDRNKNQANGDGDSFGNACDNCPKATNEDQTDADGDGIGDACDDCPLDAANDSDRDGICGNVDNCPTTKNASQQDSDGDGNGDACDLCPNDPLASQTDSDRDGTGDDCDNCPNKRNKNQSDSDGDGLGDACDPCRRDPNNLC